MRGGGRRSPPLTRRSSGGDVPHFDHPPARVNAGYLAVNRGPDGKFSSFHGGQSVQRGVLAPNDLVGGNLEGGLACREVEEKQSVGCDGADSGGKCSSQPLMADLGVYGGGLLEPDFCRGAAPFGCDIPPPSIPNPSPTPSAAAMEDLGLDLEDPDGTTLRTTAVCVNVSMENSCTGAGIFVNTAPIVEDVDCHMPPASSPTPPHPSPVVGGCLDGDDIMGTSSPPAIQIRDRKLNSCTGAEFSAWHKPGVSPLPSLKDLPHLQPLDGAARLDEEEVNAFISRFDAALVGRLFGRHIPFFHLNMELRRRWDRFGSFKLMTITNECFICFFDDVRARDAVLMGGPWAIAGQVLGLDRWTPGFSPSTSHGFVTPVWVRLPELSFYCWGLRNLASISSLLGEPMWVDDATLKMSRGAYARVCIKMDLSQPLVPSVLVIGREGTFRQQVEYEGLTAFCSKCGRVGHKNIHCNPALAAGGRMESGKKVQQSMNKAKTVGRAPIFGFSATKNTTSSPFHGKKAAVHLASSSKKSTSSDATVPAPMPHVGEDSGGVGPWKVVPPRRRGRRLKQQTQQNTAAVHPIDSSHTSHPGDIAQVQVPPEPPMDLDHHQDIPEQQPAAQEAPIQHDIGGIPPTTFTYAPAGFSLGTWEGGPLPPPVVDTYTVSEVRGKLKKRRPVIPTDDGDASSYRPP